MHKRNRNLIAMLSVMLLLVVALCACMAQEELKETETAMPSTTNAGFGVDEWENAVDGETENVELSQPTQPESAEDPSQSTQETTTATNPTEGEQTTSPTMPYSPGSLSYEEYMALDAQQQQLYALSFASVEDYIQWFNAAKAEYGNDEVVEITGPVDLGQIAGNAG